MNCQEEMHKPKPIVFILFVYYLLCQQIVCFLQTLFPRSLRDILSLLNTPCQPKHEQACNLVNIYGHNNLQDWLLCCIFRFVCKSSIPKFRLARLNFAQHLCNPHCPYIQFSCQYCSKTVSHFLSIAPWVIVLLHRLSGLIFMQSGWWKSVNNIWCFFLFLYIALSIKVQAFLVFHAIIVTFPNVLTIDKTFGVDEGRLNNRTSL